MKTKVILLWSGGKDSCLAFAALREMSGIEIVGLLTTCTEADARVTMHSVPRQLIEQQAASVGVALHVVDVPEEPTNLQYETRMSRALLALRETGINCIAAGDIFLQDLRDYREGQWAKFGLRGVFPLWQRETAALAHEFIDSGFKAISVCIDTDVLDVSFAGQLLTHDFLARLPAGVDPCGENGEYHTLVFDGPIFRTPIPITTGAVTTRGRFCFAEVAPQS